MTISPEFWLLAVVSVLAIGLTLSARKSPPPAPKKTQKDGRFQESAPFSNVVLMALAAFLLAFIVCMIVIFCVKGSVPDTLIQYTMGAGGVEAVVLAGIKISKVIKGEKVDE